MMLFNKQRISFGFWHFEVLGCPSIRPAAGEIFRRFVLLGFFVNVPDLANDVITDVLANKSVPIL